jgi:UDP-N-acetylmuramyl-tripeptide synthetase
MSKTLADLIAATRHSAVRSYGVDMEITSASADSRAVSKGCLFACMPVESRDTHEFLDQAKENGATAALVHSDEGFNKAVELGLAAALFARGDFISAASEIGHALLGNPTNSMRVCGVTGTNGKTTTVFLIREALRALNQNTGSLGTLGLDIGSETIKVANTTPFPIETANLIGQARDAGCDWLAMEASSHSLDEGRIDGVMFDAGVFLNLTQDHLDYHLTMDRYEAAKRLLYTEHADRAEAVGKTFRGAVSIADPVGRRWARTLPRKPLTFGALGADLTCQIMEAAIDHQVLKVTYHGDEITFRLPLGGRYNALNAEAALAGLLVLGVSFKDACKGLESGLPVPGRFEQIPNDRDFSIIVDFAHTPDAIEHVLDAVRELNPKRIITVFGCGGDRDRSKRPMMGNAAASGSDIVVLTSDNPRFEDPQQILNDTAQGLHPGMERHQVIDRREAVALAVSIAEEGDAVVLLGKGHEDYQLIKGVKHPMDDRDLAREALAL